MKLIIASCILLAVSVFGLAVPLNEDSLVANEGVNKDEFSVLTSGEDNDEDYDGIQPRVTVLYSNMPASWQVEAASDLEKAYELQTTNSARLRMFSELFTESHPYWYWNIALNWQYARYTSTYHIALSRNNDTLLMFSTQ